MSPRTVVTQLASPGIAAARQAYLTIDSDAVRVAALIEIAGTAATLARTLAKFGHIDPWRLDVLVSYREDIGAVLGRGRWLPTMTRPAGVPVPVHLARLTGQPVLVTAPPTRRRRTRKAPASEVPLFPPEGG